MPTYCSGDGRIHVGDNIVDLLLLPETIVVKKVCLLIL